MMRWSPLVLLAMAAAMPAAAKPKLPPCPPKGPQLFIAPMGEPFRAGPVDPYPVGLWFAKADGDGDGRLTRAEFLADADRFFAVLDADRDGEIIPDEVIRYERDIAPEIRLYARGPGTGMGNRKIKKKDIPAYGAPLGAGRWSLINIPQPVISADEDFNRAITLAEFRSAAQQRFTGLDTANAGALTLAGLPMTPAQAAATNCMPADPAPEAPARGKGR
ncbi:hypothetical protein [Edaphosphingomonas haloaromaticamans]|uniref:EF-hand domain-containing protein n=1 Tax=Edaphosphingomonas haloaromaticamans TaxID=653954 RepID=A0A1S1HG91_9SPHN|nr:hypothetical protein [Sphingomonas haloaromaticamans]OHT20476.1 hypothetical protein BHE75_02474 [Sphingomonas haloaromaticamans]